MARVIVIRHKKKWKTKKGYRHAKKSKWTRKKRPKGKKKIKDKKITVLKVRYYRDEYGRLIPERSVKKT